MKNTKEQILQTAFELFKANGFNNVSVANICEACGVTTGSFYHHYNSKSDLLYEYHSAHLPRTISALVDIMEESNPREQLWLLLYTSFEYYQALGPDLQKHIYLSDIDSGCRILNVDEIEKTDEYRDIHRIRTALAKRAQDAGLIRTSVPLEDMFRVYRMATNEILLVWSGTNGAFDYKTEMRKVFDTIFSAG